MAIIPLDSVGDSLRSGVPIPVGGDLVEVSNTVDVNVTNEIPVTLEGAFSSTLNNTTTPLVAGATFTGGWELNSHMDVQISVKSDQDSLVFVDFSNDGGVNVDTFPSAGYDLFANRHMFKTAVKTYRSCRIRVQNTSGVDQTYLRLYTYFGMSRQANSPLNTAVALDADAIITRSVLIGESETNVYKNIRASTDGNLKVQIANPLTAFGEMLTAVNFPVFQIAAVYGLTNRMRTSVTGTGAVAGATGGEFYATSGTSSTGSASVFSKKANIYRPGQGLSYAFTARFGTPVASTVQWAGPTNGTDAFYLGYSGTTFGIWYRHWGQHEIRTLTISTPASGSTNATIVIGGTSYTVALTAGTAAFNAKQITDSLTSQTALYNFTQVDGKVLCRASSARVITNTFTFSHATAVATWTSQSTGVAPTEDFTAATDFTEGNPTWLDPQKGNVFRVDVQYLGYGDIDFYAEYPDPKQHILIHRIHYANDYARPSVTNPSMRIGWTAGNRGSTTSVSCYGASLAAFVQGEPVVNEQSRSFYNTKSVSTTETALFSIRVLDILNDRVNVSSTILKTLSVSTQSTKGAVFRLILNPTSIGGTTNYLYEEEGISTTVRDIAGTTISGGKVLETLILATPDSKFFPLESYDIHLLPNDVLVVTAAMPSGGASSDCTASLSWLEDI